MSVALAELPASHQIGANNPPTLTPFEATKLHIEDLLVEAHNWADGTTVENQAQVDKASQLVDDLRKAAKTAEDLRVEEKKPLDDKIAEIQSRFGLYIADPKNKKPGKIWTAIDALLATIKPFMDAEKKRLDDIAAAALKEAADKAAAAAAAIQAASVSDLAGREAAEALVTEAQQASRVATTAAAAKPQARGGERALGLKATYTARLDNPHAALLHYWGTSEKPGSGRDRIISYLTELAQADVNRKIHTIPGVFVVEGTRL